jgi:hypothetical protein
MRQSYCARLAASLAVPTLASTRKTAAEDVLAFAREQLIEQLEKVYIFTTDSSQLLHIFFP